MVTVMQTARWLLSLLLAMPLLAQDSKTRLPNVVFVLADDLGYGEPGCFGQQKIKTPNIDRLAAQGMRLTRHYSGSPVCAPSRCVLMTGLHPGHAPIRDNKEAPGPEGQMPLAAGLITISSVLHDAGYATGIFGKWGLGNPRTTGDPQQRGFDHIFGYYCQRHAHNHYPAYLYADSDRVPLNEQPAISTGRLGADEDRNDPRSYARFRGEHFAPDRIVDEAIAFVRAHREQPFFCFLPSTLPHLALQAPAAAVAAYEGAFAETPYDGHNGYTPTSMPRATYAAMIATLDQHLGRVLAVLDELQLAEHTIVVFTSDNGATHSPVGGTDVDFFDSCGGLRGRKGSLYEGGIRVPTIVRWQGHVAAGSTSNRITGFEDWLPTLAEACGITAHDQVDGISFTPTLLGKQQTERPFLYREFAGYGGWQAVWSGAHKLVRASLLKGPRAPELYHLDDDPKEERDLAKAPASSITLQRLQAIALSEHTGCAAFAMPALDGK